MTKKMRNKITFFSQNNIHIISYRANRIKNDGTPSEWKRIVKW